MDALKKILTLSIIAFECLYAQKLNTNTDQMEILHNNYSNINVINILSYSLEDLDGDGRKEEIYFVRSQNGLQQLMIGNGSQILDVYTFIVATGFSHIEHIKLIDLFGNQYRQILVESYDQMTVGKSPNIEKNLYIISFRSHKISVLFQTPIAYVQVTDTFWNDLFEQRIIHSYSKENIKKYQLPSIEYSYKIIKDSNNPYILLEKRSIKEKYIWNGSVFEKELPKN